MHVHTLTQAICTHTHTHQSHTHTVVVPLDDLQEEGGSVLNWLSEDLEQIAIVIKVHQDLKLLQLRRVTHSHITTVRVSYRVGDRVSPLTIKFSPPRILKFKITMM